ncbi:MAG: hypothetical protein KDA77_21180, partial [Planctomycetaceae bacterium]|nr:hypothetical protein [Planctomycetaceae bacterium]
ASIAFWWNPLLRIINGQIVLFRERICDDYVVQRLGTGHALAEGIIKVAEWSLTRGIPVPLTTTLLDDAGEMEQRINRLMQGERRLSVNLNLPSAVLIGLVGLLFSAIPLMPVVRAQVAQSETALNLVDESVPVEARPEKEWSVRLRVIDNAGEQINDARVGIQLDYQGETDWQTEEQNGIFTVTVPTRIPRYCNLFVRAEGYAPMRAYWGVNQDYAADPLPAEFAFQMTKAITVGGRVIDQDNRPIVNARVLLGASSKKTDPTQRALTGFYNEEYRTDQQGQWRCELAPETISSATINVTHPDYVSLPTNYDQTAQIEELRNLTHSWTLKKGFVLTGRVVDSDGVPVAGAKLALGELNSSSSEGPFAVTDVAGRYRFENVAPMYDIRDNQDPIRFTIMVMKRGYAPVFEAVPGYGGRPLNDSTAQERVASFILKRGMKLTLHVKDSEG